MGWQRDAYRDEQNGKEHRIKDYPDELGYMHDYLLGEGYWRQANIWTGQKAREALQKDHRKFNPRQRHVLSKLRGFEIAILLPNKDPDEFENRLNYHQSEVERKKREGMYDNPVYRK